VIGSKDASLHAIRAAGEGFPVRHAAHPYDALVLAGSDPPGVFVVERPEAEKEIQLNMPNLCDACEGVRFSGRGICRQCGGTGVSEETKKIKVKIPERLYPGAVLRLKGLGGQGANGGHAGDLYLTIGLQDHPVWRVSDQVDLEADLTIYPEQAVLGDKVSVPTPDGLVQVKIQPGIPSGQKLRLKDRGLGRNKGTFGALYIRVNIDTPRQQSTEEVA